MTEMELFGHLKKFNRGQFDDLIIELKLADEYIALSAEPATVAREVIRLVKQREDEDLSGLEMAVLRIIGRPTTSVGPAAATGHDSGRGRLDLVGGPRPPSGLPDPPEYLHMLCDRVPHVREIKDAVETGVGRLAFFVVGNMDQGHRYLIGRLARCDLCEERGDGSSRTVFHETFNLPEFEARYPYGDLIMEELRAKLRSRLSRPLPADPAAMAAEVHKLGDIVLFDFEMFLADWVRRGPEKTREFLAFWRSWSPPQGRQLITCLSLRINPATALGRAGLWYRTGRIERRLGTIARDDPAGAARRVSRLCGINEGDALKYLNLGPVEKYLETIHVKPGKFEKALVRLHRRHRGAWSRLAAMEDFAEGLAKTLKQFKRRAGAVPR